MRLRLRPTERGFYPLFASAGRNIATAVDQLAALVAARPVERPSLAARIKESEKAGDDLTHEILVMLNSTFITPFDREDIYRLASRLDDVLDAIEEAADRIVLYRLDELPAGVAAQCEILCRAGKATAEAMPRLATVDQLREFTIGINSLENDADLVYRQLLAELLAPDNGAVTDLLTALKIKEVVETLEEAADAFEAVANTIESIAVKEA
jgi:predicted phosphate transport protein (TIGR00153 family)